MPTREQVLELVRAGRSYEQIGKQLSVPPGQAYMIATGLPADGSDALVPEDLTGRPGLLAGSTQYLANPPTRPPGRDPAVTEWAKQRARADRAMQAAVAQRDAEPGPVRGAAETDDVVAAIGWDHNQVNALVEQAQAIPGSRKGGSAAQKRQRVSIVDMVRLRLSEHETAEEEYFWPAVAGALPDGEALVTRARQQEQQGKNLLQEMEGLSGEDERFDDLFEELVMALRKHVAFEDLVLLRFSNTVPEDQRREIGRRFLAAKKKAPTRPHPHAPDNPAALRVASALAAPLDRVRDALGERPAKEKGRAARGPEGDAGPDKDKGGEGERDGATNQTGPQIN